MKLIILLFICLLFPFKKDTLSFISANPFSFKDIIDDLDNQMEQEVFGVLTLPSNLSENEKIPLVIGVAGSKDWADHHLEYMAMYQDMGIATFELQAFDPPPPRPVRQWDWIESGPPGSWGQRSCLRRSQ